MTLSVSFISSRMIEFLWANEFTNCVIRQVYPCANWRTGSAFPWKTIYFRGNLGKASHRLGLSRKTPVSALRMGLMRCLFQSNLCHDYLT